MTMFWNKQTESGRVVYTRTKKQKRVGYTLIILGFVLFIGIPTLIKNISALAAISQSKAWSIILLVLIGLGPALIIFTAIAISSVNFKLASAKRRNKKYQISSNNEGDTVIIEN